MTRKVTGRRRRINWWKWSFLLLLAANLALVVVLSGRVLEKREPKTPQLTQKASKSIYLGQFETKREDLNRLISHYLEDYQTKNLTYEVVVGTRTVLFQGTYDFLGYQVPLYIYLAPYKQEDGSILLAIESFSVGTLPLPAADVLRYVKASYKLPNLVVIDPKSEAIVLDLTRLDNKQGFYLKAKQVDLLNDQIVLDLYKKK